MVSIIVPVYNSINTLERCVKSLSAQTEADLEIILVDDGSTDGSSSLCDDLAASDPRIRVFHRENGGVSSARNFGLREAQGEYVIFCDSDDWAEPDLVEKMLVHAEDNDIVICGFHHHYQGRDVVKIPRVTSDDGAENFLTLYGGGFLNMPWNKLYRRTLMGSFDESLSLGEDLLFNLDYLMRADGVAVAEAALCHYVQDETGRSLSTQKREDRLELARLVWRAVSDFYEELSGHADESGVINARFVQDVLDDVESLPFDKDRTRADKLDVIRSYCADDDIRAIGKNAALNAPDYQMVYFCMRKGRCGAAYFLCVLRSALVRLMNVRGRA